MSASKKKLQRREQVEAEQVNQAEIEQAAYKKKVRLYTVIGIVVAVLVILLLVWNTGIFQKNVTAATVGDTELSVSELSYYYYSSRYTYSMYGVLDSGKSDSEQFYDAANGITWQDFLLSSALESAQTVQYRYEEALKNGHTEAEVADMVAAEIASFKEAAAANNYSYKSYLKASFGRFMTPSVLENMLTRDLLGSLYFNEIGTDKFDSFTAEELEAYYKENPDELDTITYSYLYFRADEIAVESGVELTEEEVAAMKQEKMDEAKAKAEEVMAAYDNGNGSPLVKLEEQYEPYLSELDVKTVGTENVNMLFRDELLELQPGEAAVVENEGYGYYLVVFNGRELDEQATANVRHILVFAEPTYDDEGKIIAPSEEAWAAAKAEAERIQAEFESGAQTGEAFAALAEKYSDDTGSNTNGGLYENVFEGDFVTELNDWIFDDEDVRAEGDVALVRHEGSINVANSYWGYHLIYFEGWDEFAWQQTAREIMASNYMTEWTEDLTESYPAALADGAKHIGG